MQAYAIDSNSPIAELFYQVCQAGHLTHYDRQRIMSAFLSDALTDEEKAAINRLVHAVRRGWLKVLD
ncbi:MAG: hypothetical protein SXA11_17430 [Cyanobacteriota bacterium]|nr:hypothetical protein [Cyanobacteriota bacterium]